MRTIVLRVARARRPSFVTNTVSLEAQLPTYWVPVLGPVYKPILSITQEPTIWIPGLLGYGMGQKMTNIVLLASLYNFS